MINFHNSLFPNKDTKFHNLKLILQEDMDNWHSGKNEDIDTVTLNGDDGYTDEDKNLKNKFIALVTKSNQQTLCQIANLFSMDCPLDLHDIEDVRELQNNLTQFIKSTDYEELYDLFHELDNAGFNLN